MDDTPQAWSTARGDAVLAFAGSGALMVTPSKPYVDASCQYVIFGLRGNDRETSRLLAERVLPALAPY